MLDLDLDGVGADGGSRGMNKIAVKWNRGKKGKCVVICDNWDQIQKTCDDFYRSGALRVIMEVIKPVKLRKNRTAKAEIV